MAALVFAFTGACLPLLAAVPAPAAARIAELEAQIAHHDHLYFQQDAAEISDPAYDLLKKELAELKSRWPGARSDGANPLSLIGDDRRAGYPKAPHRRPMLSLEKCHSRADLAGWLQGVAAAADGDSPHIVVEPKLDGLAISLVYAAGSFLRAVTRGNGVEGDDVTDSVLAMGGFPLVIGELNRGAGSGPVPDWLELRGEIYLPLDRFMEINRARESEGEAPFKTPRNLAAGTVRLHDRTLIAQRGLEIACYGWGAWLPATGEPDSQAAFIQRLRQWGLPALAPLGSMRAGEPDHLTPLLEACQTELTRLNAPTDGLVIKVDSVQLRRQLGEGTGSPNWAIAYKFTPAAAVTRITGIQFQIGRTGLLTPVAELQPVEIEGRTISRASLHNASFIEQMDVRLGDFVEIQLNGDTIPIVGGVLMELRDPGLPPFVLPHVCPDCKTGLSAGESSAGLRCPNVHCPAKRIRQLAHFARSVGIRGMGPATVESLNAAGLLGDIADFYSLDAFRDQLCSLLGPAQCDRLLPEVEQSRKAPLWQVLVGLGIEGVGPAACRHLAESIHSLDDLLQGDWDILELSRAGLSSSQKKNLQDFLQSAADSGLSQRLAGVFSNSAGP